MLRLSELALFLVPFLAFLGWRLLGRAAAPPLYLVAALALWVLGGGAAMVWFGLHQGLAPGSVYRPAHLEGGRIVPGQAAPR